MKINHILLIHLIILISCKDDISDEKFRNENYVFYQENGSNGKWLKIDLESQINLPKSISTYFFPNGNKYAELRVIDSFPNRIIKFYNKKRDLTKTDIYKSGSIINTIYKNGFYTSYHSNKGLLLFEGAIKNNKRQGKWKSYRKDGKTIDQVIEYVNDTLNGLKEDYWESGNLKSRTHYIKGQQNGETFHYFENGKIQELSSYKLGKRHGNIKKYSSNGKLKSNCYYWNDILKDTCKVYYENENLKKLVLVKLDTTKYTSKRLIYEYYETGELEKITEAKDNKINGTIKSFYKNGNISRKYNQINGIINGEIIEYHKTGGIKSIGFVKNNLFQKNIKQYDERGKLFKTIIIEKGVAIDTIAN